MRIHRDERGQTIILVALSLPLLLGFIGIATDVGALFKDKRTMQTAADAAAIAGALNLNYGNYAVTAAGKKASAANGYTDSSNGVTVNVVNGPTWPFSNYKGVTGYVEATVTKPESTIFLSIFGYPSVTVSARSVAAANGPGAGSIYTLGPTGTTLSINGSLTVQAGAASSSTPATTAPCWSPAVRSLQPPSASSGGTARQLRAEVRSSKPIRNHPLQRPARVPPADRSRGSCTNGLDQSGRYCTKANGNTPRQPDQVATRRSIANGANITLNGPGTYVINAAAGMNITTVTCPAPVLLSRQFRRRYDQGNSTVNLSAPNDGSLPTTGSSFIKAP